MTRALWLLVGLVTVASAPAVAQQPAPFALVGGTPPAGATRAATSNPHGPMALPCESCHTARAWTPLRERPDFDHDRQTGFPLAGRHRQADCASCHLDLRFDAPDAAPDDCASCHLDVHRGTLGDNCQTCHGLTDFALVNGEAIHARTAFPLTGSHLQVSCQTCHEVGAGGALGAATGPLPTDCYTCHADDFAGTTASLVDHVAAGFPTDCETCHSTVAFSGAPFEHVAASGGFALVGAHDALPCSACHTSTLDPIFQPASQNDCLTCHAPDADAAQPSHAGFPTNCLECHTTDAWDGATGDHVILSGGFPLRGAHQTLACASCHTGPDFELPWAPASADDCQSCHADDAAGATPPHAAFPETCTTCHTEAAWAGATVDHPTISGGFALVGAHAPLPCTACHSNPDFSLPWTPASQNDCQSCHADNAAAATPPHASFPTTCTTCHTVETWAGATLDHESVSGGFPLIGAHQTVACESCHANPDFSLPWTPAGPDDCQSCHADDAAAAQPDHSSFPTTCTTCHTPETWTGAIVDHPAVSGGFVLAGAHAAIACRSCHANPDYSLPWTPASQDDCQACHANDAAGATPPHQSFPETCQTCHGIETWQGATVDHPTVSGGFALVGAHAPLACTACHSNPDFSLPWTPANQDDCQSCHADDAAAAQPDHSAFPETCTTCHGVDTWAGATVDHPAVSGGFVLAGAHAAIACRSCHANPDFSLPWTPAGPDDCQSCHADDAAAATPPHASFPTTCTTCHTVETWAGATVNHPALSGGFALVGSHAAIACTACHSNPDFSLPWTPASQDDCQSCHADDAAGATPPHTSFPATCQTCHSVDTWAGATVDHPALSGGFALVGAHEPLPCTACHSNPDFSLPWTPAGDGDCVSCHADDAAAAQPSHQSFPTTCTTCHTAQTWAGATVDHPALSGGFALVGAHAPLACTACHSNPDFSVPWTPTSQNDCIACHQTDYDDEHAGSGFPTACLECHTTSTWAGASVNHPQFPIYSGSHEGEWDTCQSCHVQPGTFAVFSCVTCHEHRRSEMDDEHEDEDDYVYESNACYSCHPDGEDLTPGFDTQ